MAVIKRVVDALNHNRLVRSAKNTRSRLVDASFRVRGRSEADRLIRQLELSNARNVCFTIAFNVPWTIEIMIAAWRRYPTNLPLVVANNSSDGDKRQLIRKICELHDIPHIDLPYNPEWHPCRSHGIAMNWVYYNVIRRLKPDIFGFLDHDCFPTTSYDVTSRLDERWVYGLRLQSPKFPNIWNMWAGYCFYRFSYVERCAVDFKPRVELGLDTGGGNWFALYRSADPQKVALAECRALDHNVEIHKDLHLMIDEAFLHVGGASFRKGSQQQMAAKIWDVYLNNPSGVP